MWTPSLATLCIGGATEKRRREEPEGPEGQEGQEGKNKLTMPTAQEEIDRIHQLLFDKKKVLSNTNSQTGSFYEIKDLTYWSELRTKCSLKLMASGCSSEVHSMEWANRSEPPPAHVDFKRVVLRVLGVGRYDTRNMDTAQSVYNALRGAAIGVCPFIHAAFVTLNGEELYMIMERGQELHRFLQNYEYEPKSGVLERIGAGIDLAIQRASTNGLLLTDIKLQNAITIPHHADGGVRLIDVDSDYAVFVKKADLTEELKECILRCNCVAMFVHIDDLFYRSRADETRKYALVMAPLIHTIANACFLQTDGVWSVDRDKIDRTVQCAHLFRREGRTAAFPDQAPVQTYFETFGTMIRGYFRVYSLRMDRKLRVSDSAEISADDPFLMVAFLDHILHSHRDLLPSQPK